MSSLLLPPSFLNFQLFCLSSTSTWFGDDFSRGGGTRRVCFPKARLVLPGPSSLVAQCGHPRVSGGRSLSSLAFCSLADGCISPSPIAFLPRGLSSSLLLPLETAPRAEPAPGSLQQDATQDWPCTLMSLQTHQTQGDFHVSGHQVTILNAPLIGLLCSKANLFLSARLSSGPGGLMITS